MGIERKHLVGLSSSTMSMAYIVGPVISGLIASLVGERTTFVVVGVMSVLVSLILLSITPKKLLLPEREIKTWED
jgi:predicted MFS family arabinose efflux permease